MTLAVAFTTEPCPGQTENGDAIVVRNEGDDHLLAVVDALGHGPGAAVVSRAAVEYLEGVDLRDDVEKLMLGLGGALQGTRGAQGMICTVRGRALQGCGVGNVEMRVHGTRVPVVLTPGILGGRVRRHRVFDSDLAEGDRLVMFSDGISMRFPLADLAERSAQEACDHVFGQHRRQHDDASILIADVMG